jgi:hypothetical protein
VGSVFIPIAVEFHFDQGFEFYDSFLIDLDRSINPRCRAHVFGPNLAACEENVQSLAWLSIRAVQEYDGPHHFIPNETNALQRIGRARQILFGEEQVDIPGIADGTIVDRCHPRRYGVATDDGIRNLRVAERLAGSIQSFMDEFHGAKHPFEYIESTLANHAGQTFGIHFPIVASLHLKSEFLPSIKPRFPYSGGCESNIVSLRQGSGKRQSLGVGIGWQTILRIHDFPYVLRAMLLLGG